LRELAEARALQDEEKTVERTKFLMDKIDISEKPVIAGINGGRLCGLFDT
jgi:hypothetical protein